MHGGKILLEEKLKDACTFKHAPFNFFFKLILPPSSFGGQQIQIRNSDAEVGTQDNRSVPKQNEGEQKFKVGRQVVNSPSFLVRFDSEKHIDFSLTSPLGGGHPGIVKRKNQKAAAGGDGDEVEED